MELSKVVILSDRSDLITMEATFGFIESLYSSVTLSKS